MPPYYNQNYRSGTCHPGYSNNYVQHQNRGAYNYGYPSNYPAFPYSSGYCVPTYVSPSYGVPNVFSIIKTSPETTDDNVYALNSYDTLTLESGTSDHLTIKGAKTDKKITFALKNLIFGTADATSATETNYKLGAKDRLVTSPTETSPGVDIQVLSGTAADVIVINSSLVKVTATSGAINKKLQDGTVEGQRLTLANVSANDFSLGESEALSNVKGVGNDNLVKNGTAIDLVWLKDSEFPNGIWYPATWDII